MCRSLYSRWKLCTQIWKWNFTEPNWNCSRSRWLLHRWRWRQKISGHFCPTGKNIVHSVPNFPAWGVTLDRECFVYVTNCTNAWPLFQILKSLLFRPSSNLLLWRTEFTTIRFIPCNCFFLFFFFLWSVIVAMDCQSILYMQEVVQQ